MHRYHRAVVWLIGLTVYAAGLRLFGFNEMVNVIQNVSYIAMVYAFVEWIDHKVRRDEHHKRVERIHDYLFGDRDVD